MSCSIVYQGKDSLYIASDTASCTPVGNTYIRAKDKFDKLFVFNNKLYFLSGEFSTCLKAKKNILLNEPVENIVKLFRSSKYKFELLVIYTSNNNIISESYSHSNNYDKNTIIITDDFYYVYSCGLKTQEAVDTFLNNKEKSTSIINTYISTYKDLSCQEIGNSIEVYNVNFDGIKKVLSTKIDNLSDISIYKAQSLLVADAIVGKLIAGNQLQITNDNNNFVLDSNGAVLNNASFTIVSDNGKSQIKLNPTDGISIQTRPNTSSNWANQFYVDTNGNLVINGQITATSGSIGGWQIGTDRLYNTASGDYIASNGYGKLSLLSWTPSSATFNGRIYASNLGDQIKTGNIADGSVTSAKLDTLYATKAFVDEMNVELANVHTLAANAATIQQLNATNATIANLDLTNLKFQGAAAGWTPIGFLPNGHSETMSFITSVNFTDKTTTSATRTFWVGNPGRVSYWVISQ